MPFSSRAGVFTGNYFDEATELPICNKVGSLTINPSVGYANIRDMGCQIEVQTVLSVHALAAMRLCEAL